MNFLYLGGVKIVVGLLGIKCDSVSPLFFETFPKVGAAHLSVYQGQTCNCGLVLSLSSLQVAENRKELFMLGISTLM